MFKNTLFYQFLIFKKLCENNPDMYMYGIFSYYENSAEVNMASALGSHWSAKYRSRAQGHVVAWTIEGLTQLSLLHRNTL